MMQRSGTNQVGGTQYDAPLFTRFLSKIVIDVLPAAAASIISGLLITQYQFGHFAARKPTAEQAAPASAEMMQLVRDEHAMIVDYVKTQTAAEKSRDAAEDEADARAVAAAKVALAVAAPAVAAPAVAAAAPHAAAVVASKPVAPRSKTVAAVVFPVHPPLVIAQAEPDPGAAPVDDAVRAPDSLLAKTVDIKDHVVHATLHAVSAISAIPSWIASMGDRIGGTGTTSSSTDRQFSASS